MSRMSNYFLGNYDWGVGISIQTRKATGFKSMRLKYWEINQATTKCQIDLWTKLAKKV